VDGLLESQSIGRDAENEKPKNRMATLFSDLAAPQLRTLRTRLPAPAVAKIPISGAKLPMRPVLWVGKLPLPRYLARPVIPQSVSDARRLAICEAHKNCQPNPRMD
jgi:hypothetical protein